MDQTFDESIIVAAAGSAPRVVLHLAAIRSISSQGILHFQSTLRQLAGKQIDLIHVSAAIATQLALLPSLTEHVTVRSAKLPFVCPRCGHEQACSVPWQPGAHETHAPSCPCGARMLIDGVPDAYLPSRS
jgi:hypothetical protein